MPPDADAGALLRHWRLTRHLSQLELALEAAVSTRHLSYVESGRAQPSRELILRLLDTLEVPLRERNAVLVAGGLAPEYVETSLNAPEMAPCKAAIELILGHQEPYPAFVLDRHWNIVMTNRAAGKCTAFVLGDDVHRRRAEALGPNMLRLILHPDGVRPWMLDWHDTAGDMIRHLHSQIAAAPADDEAKRLLAEVTSYPGVPSRWSARDPAGPPPMPLLTTSFQRGDTTLRFFSTITTFGKPHDVTLEELRVECSFPVDAATAAFCRAHFS